MFLIRLNLIPKLLLLSMAVLSSCMKPAAISSSLPDEQLVWSDEFNYQGLPDSTKWVYDLGDGCPDLCGWGNNELQYYTRGRLKNASVEGGCLHVRAYRENMEGRRYTSARLLTKNKGDWRYGRIEVRAKLPKGRGAWPAIWMLPTDWSYGGWPRSGEIDIMEHVGYLPDSIYGSLHTQRFNHIQGTQVTAGLAVTNLSSIFHTYGIVWTPDRLSFQFDGQSYLHFDNRREGSESWPFDRKFHLLLNLAVGGNWGGKKGVDDSIWPQEMCVDYVRIYQQKNE